MSLIKKLFGGQHKPSAPDPAVTEAVAALTGCDWEPVDPDMGAEELTDFYINALHEGRMLGFHPLLVVTSDTLLEKLETNCAENAGVNAYRGRLLIEDADNGAEILRARLAENRQMNEEDGFEESELIGMFDENARPQTVFAAAACGDRSLDESLILVKLPIMKPWRCFAYLPVGNWNECPSASEMMAVCRRWHEIYGAFPAMLSHDVLQMYVPTPVTLRTEATELAEEQYAFCSDLVEQGTGTLGALAGGLIDSHIWYFWWD